MPPTSPFFLFLRENMDKIEESSPIDVDNSEEVHISHKATIMLMEWNAMPEESKTPYIIKYNILHGKYSSIVEKSNEKNLY